MGIRRKSEASKNIDNKTVQTDRLWIIACASKDHVIERAIQKYFTDAYRR